MIPTLELSQNLPLNITYVERNITQSILVLTKAESDLIKHNSETIKQMFKDKVNEKDIIKPFETNNKCKFNFNEVTLDSPIGELLLEVGCTGEGYIDLPSSQGGKHLVKFNI
jgi:hypothetical protein